jgi:hypothetical protein
VWDNAGGDYTGCLSGQDGVRDNFSENPHFCDPASGNYHVSTNSPCAAANSPACGRVGALGTACGAARYVVRPDGLGDFPTIAEAVAACADGDTVDLTDGTFTGDGNRDVDFDGKKIYMRSQSGDPEACTVDCEGTDSEYHRGFIFNSGEDRWSILEGVQIVNAYVHPLDDGGAVRCSNGASPTINNCIFAFNTAGGGAAISCLGGAAPMINGCTFYRNVNGLAGDVAAMSGAAPDVHNCTFFRAAPWAISSATDCNVEVLNTIVSWTRVGSAVNCLDNGTVSLSCSDLWANEGGDWVGCAAGQESANNNMCADPLFCDTTGVALTVRTDSDCAAVNNPACGRVGAWGTGCTPGTGVEEDVPRITRLHPCYPTPFTPTTTITVDLRQPAAVNLRVYDASGRLVRVLVDEGLDAGRYETTWNGRNQRGETVASGVYFYRLVAGSFVDSQKMVLLK